MKTWKTAASAALLATFVMTGALPALAADDKPIPAEAVQKATAPAGQLQEADAIAKVKALCGSDLKDLPFVEANYIQQGFTENGTDPVWSIRFNELDPKDPNSWSQDHGPSNSVDATLDAKTGELLVFNQQNRDWIGKEVPSEELAKEKANEFLKKAAPSLIRLLSEPNAQGSVGSGYTDTQGKDWIFSAKNVTYGEMVNGIEFPANSVSISVDKSGHVTSFWKSFRHDSSKLPKPDHAISKAEATVAFQNKFDLSKSYIATPAYRTADLSKRERSDQAVLAYSPIGLYPIDAFTGKPIDMNSIDPMRASDHKLVTVDGQGHLPVAKTKEEAKQLVGEILNMDLSKLHVREETFPLSDEQDMWRFQWSDEPTGTPGPNYEPHWINATFDGKTGALVAISKGNGEKSDKKVLTLEEGRAKALDILKTYLPAGKRDLMTQFMYSDQAMNQPPSWYKPDANAQQQNQGDRYVYSFSDVHQGVAISDSGYQVVLDPATGQILSISMSQAKADAAFPDNKNTADPNVVKATFLQNHPLKLMYVWREYMGQQAPSADLVWTFDGRSMAYSYIDAFTGREVTLKPNH